MYNALPSIFIALSVAALWTPYREAWKIGFVLALFSGLACGMLDLSSFFIVFVLSALWMTYAKSPNQPRLWALIVFSCLLKLRLLGGFYSVALTQGFYFNLAPAVAGLLPLAYVRRAGIQQWQLGFKTVALEHATALAVGKGIGLSLLGIAAMALAALSSGLISLQMTLPSHALMRYATQLFLICPLEEGLFRGFMQTQLERYMQSPLQAWLLSSVLFAFVHVYWASNSGILLFTMLAGLLYGLVYKVSKSLECAIACHFLLNFVHMTFFSYHAM